MPKSLRQQKQELLKKQQQQLRQRKNSNNDILRAEQNFFRSNRSFQTPQAMQREEKIKLIKAQQEELKVVEISRKKAQDFFLMGFNVEEERKRRRRR